MSYDKKRGKNQIGNLTPDHKPLESRVQMRFNWGMLYTVQKYLFESYKILPLYFQKNLI